MKILHTPHAFHPAIGGAELICQKVSNLLAAQGHQVCVLTTNVGAVQGYYEFSAARVAAPARETVNNVEIIRLPYLNYPFDQIGNLALHNFPVWLRYRISGRIMQFARYRLNKNIFQHIRAYQPDVVMTMPHLVINVLSVLAAQRSLNFPLVMEPMLHEEDPNWPAEQMKTALQQAGAVVALTTHEARRLESAYAVEPDSIFNTSVGIDIPSRAPQGQSKPVVLFLGRKALSKGLNELICAMRLVWRKHPSAELVIAGFRLPETCVIDQQIEQLPASERKNVRSIDNVTIEEKIALIRSSRCLVLASKNESFGMVVLEAWAQAVPAVALNLPVYRDIISHQRDGLLANPDDTTSLADNILFLLNNPEEAKIMGLRGYEEAKARYSWEHVADMHLKAYERAIDRQMSK